MTFSPETKLSHASLQEAANWYVRLHDENSSQQLRHQWQHWYEQHHEHQAAWRYIERVGQRFSDLHDDSERDSLAEALGARRPVSRRHGLKVLASLGLGSLTSWLAWRSTPLPRLVSAWGADFSTATGEVNERVLADGSHLWLNAQSVAEVDFSTERRLLTLRFGELLIDTAKDVRPFFVDSAHGRMQALGTRFSVRQTQVSTGLAVFAGAVEVRTAESQQTQIVQAGQQITFDPQRLGELKTVERARESWTRQVLVAENMPLGQLVDELAHFRHGHLACAPSIATLPVMGYFPLADTEQALRLLEAALPIRVERLTDWWVSIEPRTLSVT